MAAEGLTLSRVIGKNIGHAYTPAAIVQINGMIDAIAQKGRDQWPKEIRVTTWTLKYNRMRWVVVDGMEKEWDRARVDASIDGDHTIQAKTSNVSAVSFQFGTGARMLNPAMKVNVVIDGQSVAAGGPLTDGSWTAHLRKTGAKWAVTEANPDDDSAPAQAARPAGADRRRLFRFFPDGAPDRHAHERNGRHLDEIRAGPCHQNVAHANAR